MAIASPTSVRSQAHHKAELRTALVSAVGEEAIQRLAARLIVLARHGDMNAAKLLLDYAIGKRLETDAVTVDPVDHEAQRAWRLRALMDDETLKQAADMVEVAGRALARLEEGQRAETEARTVDDEAPSGEISMEVGDSIDSLPRPA